MAGSTSPTPPRHKRHWIAASLLIVSALTIGYGGAYAYQGSAAGEPQQLAQLNQPAELAPEGDAKAGMSAANVPSEADAILPKREVMSGEGDAPQLPAADASPSLPQPDTASESKSGQNATNAAGKDASSVAVSDGSDGFDPDIEVLEKRLREQIVAIEAQLYQEAGEQRQALESYLEDCTVCAFASEAEQKLARLDSASPASAVAPDDPLALTDFRILASSVQNELKRLGCYSGDVDGIWGRVSQRAASDFEKHAAEQLASLEPSSGMLNLLRSQTGRICPLVCDARHEVRGNLCVLKICPRGQILSSRGTCSVQKQNHPTARKTQQKRQPSNCFVFNGVRECD